MKIAFWAITPKATLIAYELSLKMDLVSIFVPINLQSQIPNSKGFESFKFALNENFKSFNGHVFFMATGIVVRMISNLISHKCVDPAVVVMDEGLHNCISLLSGHIGKANELTKKIAKISGANPVITTATDVNNKIAIDIIASQNGLFIENPDYIKKINMAFLLEKPVWLYDPYSFFKKNLTKNIVVKNTKDSICFDKEPKTHGIVIDDRITKVKEALILRPPVLSVGIGCNRNTKASEIIDFLKFVMRDENLSYKSVFSLASIDIKSDEAGLLDMAEKLKIPLQFFNKEELNNVKNIQNPSEMVQKKIGVNSVCEASAILAAKKGKLIVPKKKSKNVTIAIAKISYM